MRLAGGRSCGKAAGRQVMVQAVRRRAMGQAASGRSCRAGGAADRACGDAELRKRQGRRKENGRYSGKIPAWA